VTGYFDTQFQVSLVGRDHSVLYLPQAGQQALPLTSLPHFLDTPLPPSEELQANFYAPQALSDL
jgi:hypothetical protein